MMLGFYLVVHGIPALIASIPGFWVLGRQRWLLGWLMIAGAVVVTFPLAILADRMHTRALTEAGHVADDWPVMLARPFFFGVIYFLVASVVCAFLPTKRPDEPQPSVAPWIEDMRKSPPDQQPPAQ